MWLFLTYLSPKPEINNGIQWLIGKHRRKTFNEAIERRFLSSPLILEVYLNRRFCTAPSLVFLLPDQMDLAVTGACPYGSCFCKMLVWQTDILGCPIKSAFILTLNCLVGFFFLHVSFILISMYIKSASTNQFLLWKKSITSAAPANSFTL